MPVCGGRFRARWTRRPGRRPERPPRAALRRAYEGRIAELDGKSYFDYELKYIIKLSLCWYVTHRFVNVTLMPQNTFHGYLG